MFVIMGQAGVSESLQILSERKRRLFFRVGPRACVLKNHFLPVGHPSAILALFGYIQRNNPPWPTISNIRFPPFLSNCLELEENVCSKLWVKKGVPRDVPK